MYSVRFWNEQRENIEVGGKYMHTFNTEADAWDAAYALVAAAEKNGAVAMDINNRFYLMRLRIGRRRKDVQMD